MKRSFNSPASILCCFLLAIQFLAWSAAAAGKLQADLMPQGLRTRNDAPIPVEARFKWDGTYILEGHLDVELREGNRILGRYRSGDLALTTGDQNFRMLLPPVPSPFSDSQIEEQMKFVTAHEVFDLTPSVLFMPTHDERSLVVGWCNPREGADLQIPGLEQSFLFERYAPPSSTALRKLLITSLVRLTPDDLPAQPLDYTAYDVVVLTVDGFKEAREGQLHALARWVKGGGSVCVFVGGGLQPHHLWFLNELAESSGHGPTFLSDNDGHVLPVQNKVWCLHSGVGRSAIITANPSAMPALDSSLWRQTVAFLWKFRSSRVGAIAETGHWDTAADAAAQNSPQENMFGIPSYSVHATGLGGELMEQLMPRTVRLIPFGALMGTLGLFLLMIGPVDYFVLGWLRRRRYTWVLFPAMSLAFMVATVMMANYFLGQRDQRRSLIVVDLGKDGTAVRWNRYELIFAARDKQAVTDLKDALWAPLDIETDLSQSYNLRYGFNRRTAPRETGPPWYQGVLPVHFQTSESIRQWQPQLNRIFSFEPPPVPSLQNWRAVEDAWPNLQNIRTALSGSKPFAGELFTISSTNSGAFDSGKSEILTASILGEFCRGEPTGLLSLVSQVSPTGGGNFEDLQNLDAETSDSVLAIVTQAGDDIVLYRRLFHGN